MWPSPFLIHQKPSKPHILVMTHRPMTSIHDTSTGVFNRSLFYTSLLFRPKEPRCVHRRHVIMLSHVSFSLSWGLDFLSLFSSSLVQMNKCKSLSASDHLLMRVDEEFTFIDGGDFLYVFCGSSQTRVTLHSTTETFIEIIMLPPIGVLL